MRKAATPSTHFWAQSFLGSLQLGDSDKASEGLLLLTNDSEWAARVTAPETHLDKTYHVQIGTIADEALLESLKMGFERKKERLCR